MQIEHMPHESTSGNLTATKSFSIANNVHAFKILSSQIYSDPLLAVVREVICNAVDSHIASGQTQPVMVHLPTRFEPWFEVSDQGLGMPFDVVENLYTTYFDSSKQADRNQIGGFGIGSKTPFAITDQFTVEVAYEGEVQTFIAHLDSIGAPAISRMGDTRPTTEHNGVRVQVPIKPDVLMLVVGKYIGVAKYMEGRVITNIPEINQRVDLLAKGKSLVVEGSTAMYYNIKYLTDEERQVLRSDYMSGGVYTNLGSFIKHSTDATSYVLMGGVAYRISPALLEGADKEVKEALREGFTFPMEMGMVSPAPSREELTYDAKTIANITAAVTEVCNLMRIEFTAVIDACTTPYEVYVKYKEIQGRLPSFLKLLWRGAAIAFNKRIFMHADVRSFSFDSYSLGRFTKASKVWDFNADNEAGSFSFSTQSSLLHVTEDTHKVRARILTYLRETVQGTNNSCTVVFCTKDLFDNEVHAHYGYAPFISYEDIPVEPPKERAARVGRPRNIKTMNVYIVDTLSSTTLDPRNFSLQDIDMNEGGVYILRDGKSAKVKQVLISPHVSALGAVLVPKAHWDRFKNAKGWVDYNDKLRGEAHRRVNKDAAKWAAKRALLNRMRSVNERKALLKILYPYNDPTCPVLQDYTESTSKFDEPELEWDTFCDLCRVLDRPSLISEHNVTGDLLYKTYPLVSLLAEIPYYERGSKLTTLVRDDIIDYINSKGTNP
jgi:hypothetical protein